MENQDESFKRFLCRRNFLYIQQDKLIKEQLRLEKWNITHTKLYEKLTEQIIQISEELNSL